MDYVQIKLIEKKHNLVSFSIVYILQSRSLSYKINEIYQFKKKNQKSDHLAPWFIF